MPLTKKHLKIFILRRQKKLAVRKQTSQRVMRPIGLGLLAVLLIGLAGILLTFGLFYSKITADLPSLDELPVLLNSLDGELLESTRVMDRENQTVLLTLENPGIQRSYLSVNPDQSEHFSPQLIRAVVYKLEPGFWESSGYDLQNWLDPQPNTIAERLVSDLLLWDEAQSSARAVRMRLLAAQVVSRFGRTQVLEWYLNSAYFGHLAFGAESAAQLYFNKSAQDLSLAESAALAVLIDAPALNPLDTPTATIEMQRQFLAEMAQDLLITTDDFSAALWEELPLRVSIDAPQSLAPAFTENLLHSLESEFPNRRLERGGLVVLSSINLDLQSQFICTLNTQLARLNGMTDPSGSESCPTALLLPTQVFELADYQNLSGAGVVIMPQTGEVLAFVEPLGVDGTYHAAPDFQAGSLLTPFVALAGFARGLSPGSLEWDVPVISTDSVITNPDGRYHGATTIRSALANDYLAAMTKVLEQIGPTNVWRLAALLGVGTLKDETENVNLTQVGENSDLLELAAAYAALANSGVKSGTENPLTSEINPNLVISVRSVTNRLILDRSTPESSAVVSQPLSYLINHVLSDESARWPSLGYPNALEIGQTAAVKMGVTHTQQQVWTVGYTPERLVLVWMGNSKEDQPIQSLDPLMAAGVWHAIMKKTVSNLQATEWIVPENVINLKVCNPSGMLPTADCPSTAQEIFLRGNEPTRADTLYERIMVNRETGQRATVFTDPTLVEEQLFMNVPEEAREWAVESGLPVAPSGYDAISTIRTNPEVNINSPALFTPVSGSVTVRGTAAGERFASYTLQVGEGINPAVWLQIGAGSGKPVNNDVLAVWDTTGLDGLYAIRLTVVDEEQSLQSTTIQVTVDNTPPLVSLLYPTAEQTLESAGASITLQAKAEDSAGIQKLEWWLDGKLLASQANSPYVCLMPAEPGKHELYLIAIDNAGNSTKTSPIQFIVAD